MTDPQIDHLFADFSLPDVPGVSAIVIENGSAVLTASYGLANLETKTPCAADSNFRLASVTKQFTSMCNLMLIEQGKMSLDDSITKFFPKLPPWAKPMTVRQLLTHTSGLLDYEDLIPAAQTVQVKDKDVLHLLEKADKTMFQPGASYHYSNTGYAFLALIVEHVSGKSFATFLREHIFAPLKMENTVAFENGISTVPHRAFGYNVALNSDKTRRMFEFGDQSVTSAVLGDGGIYSSVNDLFKWDQALYTEKLISQKLLQQAFTRWSEKSDFPPSGYGYGWYIGSHNGIPSVWHYGSTTGFSTRIERYPSRKLTFILLANRGHAPLANLSKSLTDLYLK